MKLIRNFLPRVIILLAIISIIFTLYFIYENVWEVFILSKEDLILKKEILVTELKTDLLKKIEKKLEDKKIKKDLNLENLKNPFGFSGEIEIR